MAYNKQNFVNGKPPALSAQTLNAMDNQIAENDRRINEFVTLPPGSTQGNAELVDIRVGEDGVTYENAGESVRGQFRKVNNALGGLSFGFEDGRVYVEVEVDA